MASVSLWVIIIAAHIPSTIIVNITVVIVIQDGFRKIGLNMLRAIHIGNDESPTHAKRIAAPLAETYGQVDLNLRAAFLKSVGVFQSLFRPGTRPIF